jgi:3-oxoacyl-[acyl-carrier-protein] synthase-3
LLKRARVTGVGGFLPPVLTNDDFIVTMGRAARVVDRKMHQKTRFSVLDPATGRPRMTNTEMAELACRTALEMARIGPKDVDLIVYSTCTPDYPVPPCFAILQERLGVERCMGFDIRSGCAGFGSAMIAASQFLATGMARRALVVGAELLSSRYLPYYAGSKPDLPLKALFNLMFFGDGAGALVLEACAAEEGGIFGMTMGSDRPRVPFGSLIPIGGSVHPYPTPDVPRDEWAITQDGPLTEETVPAVAIEAIERFLGENGMGMQDIDCAVLPVVSEAMHGKLLSRFPGLDERVVSIGPEGGALANAAIPLSLEKGVREGRIAKGRRVLIYAAENTRWQHAVIGLVWNPRE